MGNRPPKQTPTTYLDNKSLDEVRKGVRDTCIEVIRMDAHLRPKDEKAAILDALWSVSNAGTMEAVLALGVLLGRFTDFGPKGIKTKTPIYRAVRCILCLYAGDDPQEETLQISQELLTTAKALQPNA